MLAEQVGERIARIRKQQRMTQAELGKRLTRPRSHAAVSDIERGVTKLDVDSLSEIASILETDMASLLAIEASGGRTPRKNRERLFIARTLLAYVALLLCEIYDTDVNEAKVGIDRAQVRLRKAMELDD